MEFELHPNFHQKIFIIDLPLCRVLLEDNKYYPWLCLVPRRLNVSRIMELALNDQHQLMRELQTAQEILWTHFQPTQLNVAALGNQTPQLHIHVIARYRDDPAWPGTVWDHPTHASYSLEQKNKIIQILINTFNSKVLNDETSLI